MVDAVGGVYFNVPFRMHYIDTTPGKAFTIDLEEGYQLLNGDQAMQFIRWRQNNVDGTYRLYDEGRMKLQQQFIATVAYQILKPQNALKLGTFAKVFTDNVETDLTMGNLVWFAQQALKLDSANKIQFHKLPGNYAAGSYSRTLKNIQSYVTLYPNQLLELDRKSVV